MRILSLILATFRELFSKATLYILIGISVIILLGLAAGISAERNGDEVSLSLFGNPTKMPVPADQFELLVREMQAGFARGLFIGIMLFGVFATASIIPDSLEKGTVDLYLSKPIARWELLLGKHLGAEAVILSNILFFVGGLWLVFGVKTGVWNYQLLLGALTMSFMFGCIFSIVLLLGVVFRNTAIPIIGSFIYLMFLDNMLENREEIFVFTQNKVVHGLLDTLYYVFPQVAAMQRNLDMQITHRAMEWKPFAQALLSSAGFFGISALLMRRKDF
ncbi:MAG: ABC transporter permease subunit [Ignavibacteriae bacterium]|nr:ABC transporter permease subunit [Ignavibacteriota bacterium]